MPAAPEDMAVLVLAMPRTVSESALDRYLRKRNSKQGTDLVFIYDAESMRAAELEHAARVCVSLYSGKQGVHAERAAVFPGEGE